jgi:hypothetical protein
VRKRSRRLTAIAAAILTAALPSAAAARPLHEVPGSSFTAGPSTFQTDAPQPAAQPAPGFQWDDAGVGAAGMLVLVGAGSGAVVAVRRRSVRALPG